MNDFDAARKVMVDSGQPQVDLIGDDGPNWDTASLQQDFEVLSFVAPYVLVRRRSDGKEGTLEFTHSPRVYFGFKEA